MLILLLLQPLAFTFFNNQHSPTMSFSSRRRNYLLTPHRRDGLIEWMKSMLMHSFVLDALETTGADTFSHFEMLIDEHRQWDADDGDAKPSRLKQLVPTVGKFHTHLPLRRAFEAYNVKYGLTKRKHICISFNELRHILNLAQIMALRCGPGYEYGGSTGSLTQLGSFAAAQDEDERRALQRWESQLGEDLDLLNTPVLRSANSGCSGPPSPPKLDLNLDGGSNGSAEKTAEDAEESAADAPTFRGPSMITFDGDQTLYSDGANFESNPKLALYLYLLLRNGVTVAVVTAAGYEYQSEKYELRLSGLLAYFRDRKLPPEDCERFYLFGGECNYLLRLGSDYKLHPVREHGAGGWLTSTKYMEEAPGNWCEDEIKMLLDTAETCMKQSIDEQNLRARLIRKKRAVGLIPKPDEQIPREALDESILRVQAELQRHPKISLPFCAFNGGSDAWVDCGNKRVGVAILQSYLGVPNEETLHVGDQFLNTGNDFAARETSPCVWITSPDETTYILKSILRLAGVSLNGHDAKSKASSATRGNAGGGDSSINKTPSQLDFNEIERRTATVKIMDVYTGEITTQQASR